MNGFKAYQQYENLSQFILDVKNAKEPFKVGTEYYDDQLGRLEKKWDVISKEEFYSNIFDVLLNQIADFQDALYQDHKKDLIITILNFASEKDGYVLFNPDIADGSFDLSSKNIQENLCKWIHDEKIAKLVYLEHYKKLEFEQVLKALDMKIEQTELYLLLESYGLNALALAWGVEKFIEDRLSIEKKLLEISMLDGDENGR
ncbi:hypothetical protein ACVET5_001394 [Listeria monocytogenes]